MNPALFTASAAMADNAQKMETIVHNLANAATTAYKRHIAISLPFTRFLDEDLEDMPGTGGEVFVQQHIRHDPANGALKFTDRALDVALQDIHAPETRPGEPGEETAQESIRFFAVKVNPRVVTRPRAYNIDEEFYLVEATGADARGIGERAVNVHGEPIKLPDGTGRDEIYIDPDGFLYLKGEIFTQVRDPEVVAVLDPGIQYTRNGNFHFQVDEGGGGSTLVTADGFPVQGENGDIHFDGDVTTKRVDIDLQGHLYVNNEKIDTLKVVHMVDVPVTGELVFRLDDENYVVNARGRRIIDVNGQFIVAPAGTSELEVSDNGEVKADGQLIALTLERPGQLDRGDDEPLYTPTRLGYLIPTDEFVRVEDSPLASYETRQCYLEQSNVNVVAELGQMIITMRNYEANAKLLQSIERSLQMVTNAQQV
jgi:flagellar basal body rod protein FlgG